MKKKLFQRHAKNAKCNTFVISIYLFGFIDPICYRFYIYFKSIFGFFRILDAQNLRIGFKLPGEGLISAEFVFSAGWQSFWYRTLGSIVQWITNMKQEHHTFHLGSRDTDITPSGPKLVRSKWPGSNGPV